jgi:hypothetical protein
MSVASRNRGFLEIPLPEVRLAEPASLLGSGDRKGVQSVTYLSAQLRALPTWRWGPEVRAR